MMRPITRLVGRAALVSAMLVLASGCSYNPNVAVYVGDHNITFTQVDDMIKTITPADDPLLQALTKTTGLDAKAFGETARMEVLNKMLSINMIEQLNRANGLSLPTDEDIDKRFKEEMEHMGGEQAFIEQLSKNATGPQVPAISLAAVKLDIRLNLLQQAYVDAYSPSEQEIEGILKANNVPTAYKDLDDQTKQQVQNMLAGQHLQVEAKERGIELNPLLSGNNQQRPFLGVLAAPGE